MDWEAIFKKPWQIVTLDLAGLPEKDRHTDPTITKPPILKVVRQQEEPTTSDLHSGRVYRAPRGYVFYWHDLQREHNILFVGVLKRGRA